MWGDLFEDFHDTIDVSLDRFRREYSGSWLFGYVDALTRADVRSTLIHVSARVSSPERFEHVPSGAAVTILPAPRRHRWLRALHRRFRHRKSLSSLASYGSIPLIALVRELHRCDANAILTQEYEHARFDVLTVIGRVIGLPVFASFQGGVAPHSRLERPIRPLTTRACEGLIIGSSSELERVRSSYGVANERLAPIPNAIDVHGLQPTDRSSARQQLGISESARVVEWHGRVTIRRKGLDILLAAWAEVCRQRPQTELLLLLVGTGNDAVEFQRLIDETGLGSIRWRNEFLSDREALSSYQCAADIFVLPSRHEGFPVAPIEAMALGIPVVAADAPGVTDILPEAERSGGIVVQREDVAGLAAALGRLIDDADACAEIGRRARLRAETRYSLEAVGIQLRGFMFESDHPRSTWPSRLSGRGLSSGSRRRVRS